MKRCALFLMLACGLLANACVFNFEGGDTIYQCDKKNPPCEAQEVQPPCPEGAVPPAPAPDEKPPCPKP